MHSHRTLRRRLSAAAALCAALLFSACGDDDDNPAAPAPPETLTLATATDADVEVTLSGLESPVVGYNRLAVDLRDAEAGTALDGTVVVTPMMHMAMADGSTMSHSAPTLAESASVDGRAAAEVVFIMSGTWELDVAFVVDGRQGAVTLPLEVAPGSRVQAITDGDERLFVTLVEPRQPRVGMNDAVLAVHRRETMMSFPGVADLTAHVEPGMPSMGHGSPGNVDPVAAGDGLYRGALNFTMTGDWRVEVALFAGERALPSVSFDLTVE